MNEERIERQAWLGVAFFAGLGALVLLLDQAAVIGGISLAAALLAAGALLARRRSRPAWHPNPDRADSPDNPIPRALPPQVRGHDRGAASPAPAPALSPEGQGRVAELVAVLGRAGVFAPEVPDPQVLEAAVASRGEPVTAQDLLLCLGEVGYGVPEADTSRYSANLAHHENQVEQWSDTLLEQVADLARRPAAPWRWRFSGWTSACSMSRSAGCTPGSSSPSAARRRTTWSWTIGGWRST